MGRLGSRSLTTGMIRPRPEADPEWLVEFEADAVVDHGAA